jgi:chemotaxis protein methyltransferase WspC
MAMTLLDTGFRADEFHIDAVDISARALAHAERGNYGKNSFRGNELDFRDRYFVQTPKGYQVTDAARRSVRFKRGNLFDGDFLPGAELYDIIFCRNILIYFDSAGQMRAVDLLARLLTARGGLFVGPSETSLLLNGDFVSTKNPLAFAFRKVVDTAPAPTRDTLAISASLPIKPLRPLAEPARVARPRNPVCGSLAPKEKSLSIEEIHGLADQGQLAEAALHCEQYLRGHVPSAGALHLLGLIRDATGLWVEASGCYRKALYLDPNHHQSLVLLALLLEKQGDNAGAKVLNDRVRRLELRIKENG